MAKLPSGFRHHAICHDQSVAVLGIALAQQADCLVFGKSYRLAEIDQRFRLVHMSKKNALEAFDIPGARCVPPALWCAEATQMAIADAPRSGGRQAGSWRSPFARNWRRANVEDKLDARVFERADESGNGPAFIADGAAKLPAQHHNGPVTLNRKHDVHAGRGARQFGGSVVRWKRD